MENKNTNHYEDIITQIETLIASGAFKEGDRFPSERALAEQFKVSRVPVREALKVLEYLGVLRNEHRDGLYVENPDLSKILGKLPFVQSLGKQDIGSFYEVRISLESTAVFYAAQRRSEDDINEISDILKRAKKILVKQTSSFDEDDYEMLRLYSHEFHILIVKAAHNPILTGVYRTLFSLLDYSKHYTINREYNSFDSLLAHEAILTKIISKDAIGAREDMIGHLKSAHQKIDRERQSGT